MKRRTQIVAGGLIAAVAAMMAAGCSTQQTADCVDAHGNILPDNACQNNYPGGGGYGYISHPGAHYVYGGNISTVGSSQRISGGSLTPSDSADIVTRSGTTIVSRGGFGGSVGEHGDGGEGGEGHGGGGE